MRVRVAGLTVAGRVLAAVIGSALAQGEQLPVPELGFLKPMDFDSTELGYGLFFSPASGQIGGSNKSLGEAAKDGLFWEFTPQQPGVYSLFCRIHPFMRGAFEVVQ